MPNSVSWLAKQVNNKDVVNQFVPDEFVEPLTGSHPHADIKKPTRWWVFLYGACGRVRAGYRQPTIWLAPLERPELCEGLEIRHTEMKKPTVKVGSSIWRVWKDSNLRPPGS